MVEALIQRAGQGRIVQAGGMTLEYLAESGRSNDGMGIYLLTLAPQSPGAGPHYHQRMTETFHVHSGVLSMMVDNKPVEVKAGDFILIPPTVPHAFANRSDAPVVFTLSFTPAFHREGFFEGMAALSAKNRMGDRDAMLELMTDYDQVVVEGIDGWTERRVASCGGSEVL